MLLTIGLMWAVHRYRNVDRLNRGFRVGQLFSAAAFSLGHGGNDAQKTMGVILAVLISSGHLPTGSDVPLWVVLSAHVAIALGTLTGGWRIVKTMGSKITRLAARRRDGRRVGRRGHACSSRRTPASRCRPHTRSPAASSASVPAAVCPPFVGEWPDRVVWAWILTIPGAWLIATADVRNRGSLRLMDRRALFFLGAAVVCAVLIPVTESEQRWVPIALSIVYTLLALASWADARGRSRIDS